MKAAIVQGPNQTPVYGDFAEPEPAAGENRIRVSAAALSPLARGRAPARITAPRIFSLHRRRRRRRATRRRQPGLFSHAPRALRRHGGTGGRPVAQFLPFPDGLDDITAAAIANPAMSSCAALRNAPSSRREKPCWSTARPAPRASSRCRSPGGLARPRSLRPAAISRRCGRRPSSAPMRRSPSSRTRRRSTRASPQHSRRAWTWSSTICGERARSAC